MDTDLSQTKAALKDLIEFAEGPEFDKLNDISKLLFSQRVNWLTKSMMNLKETVGFWTENGNE